VWEEANERGYVERRQEDGREAVAAVTPAGSEFLRRNRPLA
jgi:hypothetical protein